jgi:WXG100 family type VII secretion target
MTVALTPAEADQKIAQINDARDQAVSKLKQIENSQQSMLSSAWQGGSASKYGNTSQQQQEDFNQIITSLNDIVEKGSTHIRSISHQDSN